MEVTYGQSDIKNLVYSDILKQLENIKVSKKKNERRYNDSMRLLLAEVAFITTYIELKEKEVRIIYMGCAPGFHLIKLMKLYPFIHFDLYDDQELHPELEQYIDENSNQVNIYRELFKVETTERYSNSEDDIYLITDHRELKYMKDPIYPGDNEIKMAWQIEKEASYMRDMELQKEICIALKPIYACLRFRPPHYYSSGPMKLPEDEKPIFEYFSGVVWLMIFNDYKSTESRLVVNDFDNIKYGWNYQTYQYRLNYFNDEVRESLLLNPLTKQTTPLPNSLGNKFEPIMMMQIVVDYMHSIGITDIRIGSLMKFYEKFLVVELCSDIKGMYSSCNFESVHIENAEDSGPQCEYFDDSIQMID
jgi:hypothetical protein